MTATGTQPANHVAPPPPPVISMPVEKRLPLAALIESSTNPRRVFDAKDISELADSIKQSAALGGLLVPLLVRPAHRSVSQAVREGLGIADKSPITHEIIAGARRYRAAKLAGLVDVPVRIVEIDDAAVLELQLVENLQRKDVHPLEEAEGYARLLTIAGYTAEVIASKVGKDRSYVYRRLSLCRAIEPCKQAFLEGRISLQLVLRIARLPREADQLRAFEHCFEAKWVRTQRVSDIGGGVAHCKESELSRFISEEILLELSAAPWKKDDVDLVPAAGACNVCEKRSGAQPALFDDVGVGKNSCLDAACYQRKRKAFVQITIDRGAAAGKPLVTVSREFGMEARELEGALARGSYREIVGKADQCSHVERAVIAHGEGVGKQLDICRAPACAKHRGGLSRSTVSLADAETPAQLWARKRKKLDEQIDLDTRRELLRLALTGGSFKAAKLGDADDAVLLFVGRWAIERAGHDGRREMAAALKIEKKGVHDPEKELMALLKQSIEHGLGLAFLSGVASSNPYSGKQLEEAVKLLGINKAGVRARVSGPLLKSFEDRKAKALGQGKAPVKKVPAAKKAPTAKKVPASKKTREPRKRPAR